MTLKDQYQQNKPLFYALLTGLIYVVLFWFQEIGESLVSVLMVFLPGITFPLATVYFSTREQKIPVTKIIIHFILSYVIYMIIFFLFYEEIRGGGSASILGEPPRQYKQIILAGFIGSLLFHLLTKYLLKKEFTFTQITLTAVFSGIAMLPYLMFEKQGAFLGLSILLWTIINGLLLNSAYKKNLPTATN